MDMLLPDIEDDIPLPKKASEAFPDLLPNEELEMRVRTIKLLSDLTGEPVVPTAQHRIEAQDLAQQNAEPQVASRLQPLPQRDNGVSGGNGGSDQMYVGR
jgi:hypothetical protein